MTITFEDDSDIIIYVLEKIISYRRENQYFFAVNCAWWLASVIGLDIGLRIHIDNLAIRQSIAVRSISTTPRDIARTVSPLVESEIEGSPTEGNDPLRKTRQGRINPLPRKNQQLKRGRKRKT
jgi:hypothetical protein